MLFCRCCISCSVILLNSAGFLSLIAVKQLANFSWLQNITFEIYKVTTTAWRTESKRRPEKIQDLLLKPPNFSLKNHYVASLTT